MGRHLLNSSSSRRLLGSGGISHCPGGVNGGRQQASEGDRGDVSHGDRKRAACNECFQRRDRDAQLLGDGDEVQLALSVWRF
jgi:hypothetical protein